MLDPVALSVLIAALECATEPSNDLAKLACEIFAKSENYPAVSTLLCWALGDDDHGNFRALEAAVALAERLLPGWWWRLEMFGAPMPKGLFQAHMFTVEMPAEIERREIASQNTAALALVLATLRAVEAQSKETK